MNYQTMTKKDGTQARVVTKRCEQCGDRFVTHFRSKCCSVACTRERKRAYLKEYRATYVDPRRVK